MFLKTRRGSLRSDDSDGSHNNAQKLNFHSFNLYHNNYPNSFNFQMQGDSFGVDSLITIFKFRKRKKILYFMCYCPR